MLADDGVLIKFSSENCGRWLNEWERGAWQARDDYKTQYKKWRSTPSTMESPAFLISKC